MLKVNTSAQGRLPGRYQQGGGRDDKSFSVWHSGQEESAVKSLANIDALGNHIHAGNGMKLSSCTKVFGVKLRESMKH